LVQLGRRTRAGFLQRVEQKLRNKVRHCGLSLPELLIDVSDLDDSARDDAVQQYLRLMQSSGSRDCWGGAAELVALAHMSKTQIFLLEGYEGNEGQLLTGLIGLDDWKLRIGLVFSGAHYDAVPAALLQLGSTAKPNMVLKGQGVCSRQPITHGA
jgi:hypothetical protein